MTDNLFKAACIQLASGSNVNANLLEAQRLMEHAAREGARLIVLPENFAYMGASCQDMLSIREEDNDGPIQHFLSQISQKLGVWLVGGTLPIASQTSDKLRAACLLYNDQGQRVARYDKMHLFDVNLVETDEQYVESETIEPGDELCVVDTPFGKLGLSVCYDLRFPEMYRALLDQGMELIALPAAFTAMTGAAHWDALLRARAIENLCFVLAAAQGGFHISGRKTWGHSMIVDPWGNKLAEQTSGNGPVIAEINRDFLQATRRNFPSLQHRRFHCT
ncbi:MAG TPA: carbon-nitrogen hydrolase family protein [Thiolapillus brandeum]|uniref:Carbon-nitrogen hydrolase family protein n=1 Tax=Thiolapillus brandeum TaxID=1076588 RepID=A0A831RXD4_9GAMM|nr:carbon-nitrogen hydrolase family protein [Thiolapillus brandeum]